MRYAEIVTEKCWKGYEKKGMKTCSEKRVQSGVKKEDIKVGADGNLILLKARRKLKKNGSKDKWVRFGPDGKIPEAIVQEVHQRRKNQMPTQEVKHTH